MNTRLQILVLAMGVAGAVSLFQALLDPSLSVTLASPLGAVAFAVALVLAILSEIRPMPYPVGRESKSENLTIVFILAALYIFGWPFAVVLAVTSVVVADTVSRKESYKIFFNAGMYSLSTLGAAAVFYSLLRVQDAWVPAPLGELVAGLAAGVTYYVLNVTMLMTAISLRQETRLLQMIGWGLQDAGIANVALVSIANAAWFLWQIHPVAPVVLAPVVVMARTGYEGYTRLRTEAESTMAAVADLLDLRDHNTGQHSRRVSELTWGVAHVLGVPEPEATAIRSIARVHDVGKIVVRDKILLKPGSLSPEEMLEIHVHVEAAEQILNHLSVYKPHLSMLLQHHERLDGKGYPRRLRAEEIGRGARILAVCDAYDTMTSNRPYRAAAPRELAMAELYRHVGTQFDLDVVKALETYLIQERKLRADWRAVAAQMETLASDVLSADAERTPLDPLSPLTPTGRTS